MALKNSKENIFKFKMSVIFKHSQNALKLFSPSSFSISLTLCVVCGRAWRIEGNWEQQVKAQERSS
jgi:hypothetical protein